MSIKNSENNKYINKKISKKLQMWKNKFWNFKFYILDFKLDSQEHHLTPSFQEEGKI